MMRVDAVREIRVTEQTYYRWSKQHGGMAAWEANDLQFVVSSNYHCTSLRRARSGATDLGLVNVGSGKWLFQGQVGTAIVATTE
jgi:hypothetical protein